MKKKYIILVVLSTIFNLSYGQEDIISKCEFLLGQNIHIVDNVLTSQHYTKLTQDRYILTTKSNTLKGEGHISFSTTNDTINEIIFKLSANVKRIGDLATNISELSYGSMLSCLFWQSIVILNTGDTLMFMDGTLGDIMANGQKEKLIRGKISKEEYDAFSKHYKGNYNTFAQFLPTMIDYMGAKEIIGVSDNIQKGSNAYKIQISKKKHVNLTYIVSQDDHTKLQELITQNQ